MSKEPRFGFLNGVNNGKKDAKFRSAEKHII